MTKADIVSRIIEQTGVEKATALAEYDDHCTGPLHAGIQALDGVRFENQMMLFFRY